MKISGLGALIGESAPMREMRTRIAVAARTSLSVLIQGPTGSGKELVAAALHAESDRSGKFVAFNVCAISDTMFEDALFGHVRGAFTGAVDDSLGYLREAHLGTAFLDEVSGLPSVSQAKLLRALETGQFRPVGGKQDVRSDARVLAATNEDLGALVADNRFRRDLAHRLAGVTIHVPSLGERAEDIPLLVRHFLDRGGFTGLHVSTHALELLRERAWPGNIRELKQFIEWAAVLTQGHLDEGAILRALATHGLRESPEGLAAEAAELREVLTRHAWNKSQAARELGVHLTTIYRRMEKHRIVAPRAPRRPDESTPTGVN
jgi:DNA-binding NtrC family response regulator